MNRFSTVSSHAFASGNKPQISRNGLYASLRVTDYTDNFREELVHTAHPIYIFSRNDETVSHFQTYFYKHKHHGDFNERANDGCEGLAGVNTKDRNSYRDSQFEIVAGGRQRQSCRLTIAGAPPLH